VFQNFGEFKKSVIRRVRRLDGRAPLSLLNTDTALAFVEELLIQIDEGMFI
jgi:hypothetical protein